MRGLVEKLSHVILTRNNVTVVMYNFKLNHARYNLEK